MACVAYVFSLNQIIRKIATQTTGEECLIILNKPFVLTTLNGLEQFKKPFSTFPSVRNSSLTDAIHLGQTGHLASPCFAIKEDFKPEITPGDSSCWFPSSQWHLTDESSNFSRVDFHRFRTVNCAVLVTLLRQIQFVSNFLFWPLLNLGFSNKDYSTTVLPNAIFCFFSHLWNFLSYGTFFFSCLLMQYAQSPAVNLCRKKHNALMRPRCCFTCIFPDEDVCQRPFRWSP